MATYDELFDIAKPSVRRSMVFLATGALIGLAIAGYGLFTAKGTRSHGVPPEAVALVNQRPILRSDFMTQAQTQFAVPFAQTTHAQRMKTLQDMLNEELLMQRGLEIDLPSYDPDVRNALVAGVELEVFADVLAQQPTDAELHNYYEQHKDKYSSEGVMKLRDLVIKTDASTPIGAARNTANEAVSALRHGRPLDSAIQQFHLVDSGRFMDAGHVDLGDIFQFAVRAKVDMVIYNATLPLKTGEVSDPVNEVDGIHIIVMVQHRFPAAQTFEEASNRVWTDLRNEIQAKVRSANLTYLHNRADVVIVPEYVQ